MKSIKSLRKSGILLVEVLVALTIITIGISSAVFLVSLNQSTQVSLVRSNQAVGIAQSMLMDAKKQNIYDFIDSATTTDNFTKRLRLIFETPYRARIQATVSWNIHGTSEQKIELADWVIDQDMISNFVDCPVWHRDWSNGRIVDHDDLNIPSLEVVTDGLIYNQYLYLSTDSASTTQPDLYVIDIHDPIHPTIVNAVNTGPGIARMTRMGEYVYVANKGSSQLQVISLTSPTVPVRIVQLKLPGVTVSNGGGIGESVFALNDRVYIGVTKVTGPELHQINISNPTAPYAMASAEIGSGVTDIFVWNDKVYVSDALQNQLTILNTSNLSLSASYAFDNWQTQSAQQLFVLGKSIYVGRSSGGFSNQAPELVTLTASGTIATSTKLAKSVDAIVPSDKNIFVLTYDAGMSTLSIIDQADNALVKTFPLVSRSVRLLCDQKYIYSIAAIPSIGFNLFSP